MKGELEGEFQRKAKLICTILAYIFLATNLVLLTIIMLYDFSVISLKGDTEVILGLVWFFSFIIWGILRHHSNKTAKTVTLVLGVISMSVGVFAIPYGFLTYLADGRDEARHRRGQELATMENVLGYLAGDEPILHNEESKDCGCTFIDKDKKILEKFNALEYTFVGEGKCFVESSTYISNNYDMCKITLSKDCDGLIVYNQGEHKWFGSGYDDGINSYSIDAEQGEEIKKMIDHKISLEKAEYDTALEENLSEMTIEKFVESLEDSDTTLSGKYNRVGSESESVLIQDSQEKIKNTFKLIDISQFEKLAKSFVVGETKCNIELYSTADTKDKFEYYHSAKLFRSRRYCDLPYFRGNVIYLDYFVTNEIDEALMNVVKEVTGLQ